MQSVDIPITNEAYIFYSSVKWKPDLDSLLTIMPIYDALNQTEQYILFVCYKFYLVGQQSTKYYIRFNVVFFKFMAF